jgi:ketosteroid isomerase-like protein
MRNPVSLLTAFAFVLISHPAVAANPSEKAVLAAVETWKGAMLKQDRAALEKILHSDLSYGYPSAIVHTKSEMIQHVMEGAGWEAIDLADTTVGFQGNVAIVRGKVDMHQRNKDKPTTTSKLLVLTVWVKGPQGWQLVARQAVRRADDAQVLAAKAALAPTPAKAPASASLPPAAAK